MVKKSIVFATILALMCFFSAYVVLAGNDAPAEPVKILDAAFGEHTKAPVMFDHSKHQQDACTDCHHDNRGDKNTWKQGDPVKKCGECHTAPAEKVSKKSSTKILEGFKQAGNPNLEEAFHTNCFICHRDKKVKTTCAVCHNG
ncbi:MAG: cytochrome c3 family protein [Pseudomonadota bacterium]